MSRFLCITCLLLIAPAAALGTNVRLAGNARVIQAQQSGQTPEPTGRTERPEHTEPTQATDSAETTESTESTQATNRAARLQAENLRLTKQHNLQLARKQRYQGLTLASLLLISWLCIVLYLSHRRLRHVRRAYQQVAQFEQSGLNRSQQSADQSSDQLSIRLAQAERMESLGSLAGGIAHDFNNLLVGVVCNAEVLQMYHEQTPGSTKCIDGILKAAETASELSQKMLAYAGRQASEKQPLDLNEVVSPIVSLVKVEPAQTDVRFTPSKKPAIANVDKTQIEQIVLNLLHNAREAIGDDEGSVCVSITEEHIQDSTSDPELLGKAVPGGNYVAIEVRDNGPGIDAADIARMFEPFRSSRPGRGRGLGLAVVYGHVNRHAGLIRVQSQLGSGTTVRILLPRSQQKTAPAGNGQLDQVASNARSL